MTTHFSLLSSQVYCETVSLLQFYKFIIKCWQWCLKGNKLMRLNKLLWNEPEILRILYQIGIKVQIWCFYLVMVYLSLLEGFLWFPLKAFCSHKLKCYSCQKKVNNIPYLKIYLFFFEPIIFNVLWKSYQKISWGYF